MTMTRDQLGNIISARMATRTMHLNLRENDQEITGKWIVRYLETDETGVLNIYCEAPKAK